MLLSDNRDSPGELHLERDVVVEEREGDTVLAAHGLPDDYLVDVVELVPVLVPAKHVRVSDNTETQRVQHLPGDSRIQKLQSNEQSPPP